jgi:TrmH family RNA methyltransferase
VAAETSFTEPLLRFILDVAAEETADGHAAELASLLAAVPELNAGRPAAEPAPRVFVSGWGEVSGVLLYRETAPGRDGWQAVVAARDERALRDLLLGFPGRGGGTLFLGGRWMLAAVRDLFTGKELAELAGYRPLYRLAVFAGSRRGARYADGSDRDARTVAPQLAGKDTPAVQRLRALREPAARRAEASFVAEGPTLVQRALRDALPVEAILCLNAFAAAPEGREIAAACARAAVPCYRCSDGLMGTVTSTRPLPAVIAAVHFRLDDVGMLRLPRSSVLLITENLQNPDNLGMVLRTADGAGAGAVVVTEDGVDPLHKNCVRAARGAVGRIPLYRCADLPGWLGELSRQGFATLGATAHADADLFAKPLDLPLAFVVGNEETGLRPPTLAACTGRVRIPMAPGQSSLNVGVAAGVLLFEFVRRSGRQ